MAKKQQKGKSTKKSTKKPTAQTTREKKQVRKKVQMELGITEPMKEEEVEITPSENLHFYEIQNPIFLGSLWMAVTDYLERTGHDREATPLTFLSSIGAKMAAGTGEAKVFVCQDLENRSVIAGFAIVRVDTTPMFRVWLETIYQHKNYAKYGVGEQLRDVVERWAQVMKIQRVFVLAEDAAHARGYISRGLKPTGMVLTMEIPPLPELEEKDEVI